MATATTASSISCASAQQTDSAACKTAKAKFSSPGFPGGLKELTDALQKSVADFVESLVRPLSDAPPRRGGLRDDSAGKLAGHVCGDYFDQSTDFWQNFIFYESRRSLSLAEIVALD
jgi:hypothetical protein